MQNIMKVGVIQELLLRNNQGFGQILRKSQKLLWEGQLFSTQPTPFKQNANDTD